MIKKINPYSPQDDLIDCACQAIRDGKIIIYPTIYLYGIGADAFNSDAVYKIFEIKKRPLNKPVLVLIPDKNYLHNIVKYIPPIAFKIIDKFWPGNITIIFEANENINFNLTAGTGKIGVRMPSHPVAVKLLSKIGSPITGTSANISGNEGCFRISDLDDELLEKIDLILDAGELKGGIGSTIIDVTVKPPVILRKGEFHLKKGGIETMGGI